MQGKIESTCFIHFVATEIYFSADDDVNRASIP